MPAANDNLSQLPSETWARFRRILERFEEAWQGGERPAIDEFLPANDERAPDVLLELVHMDLERRLKAGESIRVETYLERYPTLAADTEAALDLIAAEYQFRRRGGSQVTAAEYLERFPQYRARLAAGETHRGSPVPPPADSTPLPQRIGRHRIERVLEQGSFGLVYLAYDEQLSRPVAIKVPHARLVAQAPDAEAYLVEARTVANFDHPNIVPVYDVGSTDQFPCYVISKYIDGSNLKTKAQTSQLSLEECAELVATVADALHYAHKQGIVHRDIKPGNILLDKSGKPFVADFGLALREQDVGKGPRYAGTPAYTSPEQARGEGHRVDGRSDIFSLGVVLYELLTRKRPFQGHSRTELLEQIISVEVRPPRQIDDRIPKELERICLKTLAKRASDRYTTAKDMADDLRHFLAAASVEKRSTVTGRDMSEADAASPVPTPSDRQAVKIVPKGLRSFDADDADFFLELLPGPRDREDLPESIRFWKSRIETPAPDTFCVGLIYGPTGCGKSSLLKAGLLPRLAKSVTAVYVEAATEETEARLLKGLRRQVAQLTGNLDLVESVAALRRGQFLESGRKVLLVLDQFEQWLHARRGEGNAELVQALRHCDGARAQCLLMVRDDFWMAATRFMGNLEINLVQGQNCAAVDLFDPLHARKVLFEFGRAYGRLPDDLGKCAKEQQAFLDQAVAGLVQDGKVISVRLALFAEMIRGKPWTLATLREVGGTEGVGITFLEETFAAPTAPPHHRLHQKAAQAMLKALLPEAGTDMKGHMRSQQELLEASGYAKRPKDFDDVVRILDSETRLITPTDPEGRNGNKDGDADSLSQVQLGQKHYQLTHDYLVPSLREWLIRKEKDTMRGRAYLRLAERAALWNSKRQKRRLPGWWEWANIRLLTRKRNWTQVQRKMMREFAGYHMRRVLIRVALVALLALTLFVPYPLKIEATGQLLPINVNNANRNPVDWQIELRIPQKQIGQILAAYPREMHAELQVDFLVVSAPNRSFKGKLRRDRIADDPRRVVRGWVRIHGPDIAPEDQLPPELLLSGSEVQARIRCGNRALTYCLLWHLHLKFL